MIGALLAKSIVRKGFATVTGGNVEALTSVFDQEAAVIYPTKGTISGLPAILDFYRHFKTVFPQVRVDVKEVAVANLFDLVGTNVLAVCFEVYTTDRKSVV